MRSIVRALRPARVGVVAIACAGETHNAGAYPAASARGIVAEEGGASMSDLAGGSTLRCEEAHAHHWLGSQGSLVALFAYEGSHDDARHVEACARLVERTHRERGAPVQLLFVLVAHDKRPTAKIHKALRDEQKRIGALIERIAVVLVGSGFAAAMQRGAINGVLGLLGQGHRTAVFDDVGRALRFLGGATPARFEGFAEECLSHARGGVARLA